MGWVGHLPRESPDLMSRVHNAPVIPVRAGDPVSRTSNAADRSLAVEGLVGCRGRFARYRTALR